jgi:hypothetical protein
LPFHTAPAVRRLPPNESESGGNWDQSQSLFFAFVALQSLFSAVKSERTSKPLILDRIFGAGLRLITHPITAQKSCSPFKDVKISAGDVHQSVD